MNITYKQNAVLNGDHYHHFGIQPSLANLYGDKPEDIVEVEIKISEDQTIPKHDNKLNPDYWGWFDDDRQEFTMIYAKRFLLEMCFPNGIKPCEEKNQGKAYRLEII
jgi:hypothetical protein